MGKRLVAFAALGLGAAGLLAGPARADVIAESGTPVTFTGGCMLGVGVLNSTSTPDCGSLTVRPESVVNFVNRLGTDAVLHVGGSSMTVPADHAAPVTIHRGPIVKAEPLRKGATGLLALIVAVLLFGVGAAVIRTIVAQRGARPAVA